MRPSDDPAYKGLADHKKVKANWVLTTTAERFLALDNVKAVLEVTITRVWKRTRPRDIRPAERCMHRKVLKETPRMSARKLRCGPRNRGIKLISERLLARTPAVAMLGNRKPRQTELLKMYAS